MFQFSGVMVLVYKVRALAKPISSTDPALRVLGDSRCRERLARKLMFEIFHKLATIFSQILSNLELDKLLNIRKLTRALFDSLQKSG
jgi:hypothetical protein